jgi:hypothetical protein
MADSKKYRHLMGELLAVAIRSFGGTMLLMLCVGLVLAGGAYYILAEHHTWVAVIAALAALVETLAVGLIWACKRALLMATLVGLQRYGFGKAAVRLLFGRVLGLPPEETMGQRSGALARSMQWLPLAQAEKRLTKAAQIVGAGSESGGLLNRLRARLQRKLLGYVQALTLSRFREFNARHGGVDLSKVQAELELHVDELLLVRLRRALNVGTFMVLVGLPAQVMAMVLVVLALMHSHGSLFK